MKGGGSVLELKANVKQLMASSGAQTSEQVGVRGGGGGRMKGEGRVVPT